MKAEIFNYKGNDITFQTENGGVMVNATQMAKQFGKRPVDWLRSNPAKEFVNELSKVRNLHFENFVLTKRGGYSGTWMHEDVALEFARWLNPRFAIWCNDKIKELLTTGKTQFNTGTEDQAILQAMKILMNRDELQKAQLKLQAPKVEYFDEILQSKSTYNTNQIAKEFGFSAVTLNRKLAELEIQYKQNGTWLLYAQYQNKDYVKTKTFTYVGTSGETKTSMQTVWTEKGRLFIHKVIRQQKIINNVITKELNNK